MAVFSKALDNLDPNDVQGSLRKIKDFLSYMQEQIEFSTTNVTKSVAAAGISSTEVYALLVFMQNSISALTSTVNSVQGQVTTLNTTISTIQGNVTTIQGQISSLDARVHALEGGS